MAKMRQFTNYRHPPW